MVSHVKIIHSIQIKNPIINNAIGKNKNLKKLFFIFIFSIPLTWFYIYHITNILIYLMFSFFYVFFP